ncbi:hypothetical protein [Clostridium estertheticum]|uniref:Uncharacterized protein n=1 Tax=Clostridium estertheticum TaxID=238834 RepID=A0AA47I7I7_9CLOT|nr:hypothetical protein [Clostridium estertheticum]MBU3153493.1 hypothetical protein [Clostridium estertheticum]WAG60895.1 hypothetical protein LL038_01185 [Clostridium estertheticum]
MNCKKYLLYKCIECNEEEITNNYHTDGRRCKKCSGHLVSMGYIKDINKIKKIIISYMKNEDTE